MRSELDALISQMHKGGILYTEAVREFRKTFIAMVLRKTKATRARRHETWPCTIGRGQSAPTVGAIIGLGG
jgi:hypothetical protein